MKKMYHPGNCTTCQAIIKETGVDKKGFVLQHIKEEKITPAQLDEMKKWLVATKPCSAAGP